MVGSRGSKSRNFRCVAPVGDWCGEAPVWSTTENALYWTDINRFLVHRLNVQDETVRTWVFPEPVTALVLTGADGVLAVALASKLVLWDSVRHTWDEAGFDLEGSPGVRLNDGRADPRGSFWVGSMRNNVNADGSPGEVGGTEGMLFRIDPDMRISVWERGIGIANTIAWSPDSRQFYFADTLTNIVSTYDYDPSDGSITNKRPLLVDFPRGLPDGSAVDSEGYLWNCRVGGGCLARIAPNGVLDEVIEFPGLNPTSCTFGGQDLATIYVTSSGLGISGDRFAGGLFAMDAGVCGLPENRFAIKHLASMG